MLTAGPWAISPPPVTVDPSYFAPASFLALHAASKDPRWEGLAASARAITSKLMPGPGRLPPDWAHLQGDTPVPIGDPSHPQAPPVFGFDAVRTLVRFAEDPNPAGRRIAARAWPAFENQDPTNLPVEHDLSGKPIGHTLHPVVLVSAAGAADAAGHAAARDGLLDAGRVARPALAYLLRRGVGGARADHARRPSFWIRPVPRVHGELPGGPQGASPTASSTRLRNAAAVGRSCGCFDIARRVMSSSAGGTSARRSLSACGWALTWAHILAIPPR